MACKKSDLVSAINSFIAFSANLIGQLIDTLEFEPEAEETKGEEAPAEVEE